MKRFMCILALVLFAQTAIAANSQEFSYNEEDGSVSQIKIYDDPSTLGEERIELITTDKTLSSQSVTLSSDSYEASIVLMDSSGDVLTDLSVGASFGASYLQIKELLKNEDFKSSFSFLSDDCGIKGKGFLMITDNLDSSLKGYCLY